MLFCWVDTVTQIHVLICLSPLWWLRALNTCVIVQCQRQILSADLTTLSHLTSAKFAFALCESSDSRKANGEWTKQRKCRCILEMLTTLLLIHNKDLLAVIIIYVYYSEFRLYNFLFFFLRSSLSAYLHFSQSQSRMLFTS